MLKLLDLKAFLLWKTHPSRTYLSSTLLNLNCYVSPSSVSSSSLILFYCFSFPFFMLLYLCLVFFSRILPSLILLWLSDGYLLVVRPTVPRLSLGPCLIVLQLPLGRCRPLFDHRCSATIRHCSAHHAPFFGHHPQL